MAFDLEKMMYDYLLANWSSSVKRPVMYYEDKYKTIDTKTPTLRVYLETPTPSEPKGLGYPAKDVTYNLVIDIRCMDRTYGLQIRDETVRILDLMRNGTGSGSLYTYLKYVPGEKVNSYVDNYRWVIDVALVQLLRPTTGM